MSEVLQRQLDRANRKVVALENLVETKTRDLFEVNRSLEAANSFMTQVLRSMAGALIVTDADRRVQLVNKRFSALLGFDADDMVGQVVNNVLPNAGTFPGGGGDEIVEHETYCVRADGSRVPVALTTGRIQAEDDSGTAKGYVYIAIDIRERKAAESRLKEAQRQLVDASRQAGMAEIATGVLHNVGNVLNSVNVAGNVVRDQIRGSRLGSVSKLADLLESQQHRLGSFFEQDPKGQKVPGFLRDLATHLNSERETMLKETDLLLSSIDHIKTIVSSQQSFAGQGGAVEVLAIESVIEAALDMYESAFIEADIEVRRDFRAAVPVEVDRHKALQIIVNFLTNARRAIDERGGGDMRVVIRTKNEDGRVCVSVTDTGNGIPAENLEQVFNHGFTTKEDGHGFGLHSSANAAAEMGGHISCHSDGIGRGATFSLFLPVNSQEEAA